MPRPDLGVRLRVRLGPEACEDLTHALEEVEHEMLTLTTDRLDGRLVAVAAELRAEIARADSQLRVTIADGFASVRRDIANMQAEVLRWAFLFWLGQFAAMVGLLTFVLRPR